MDDQPNRRTADPDTRYARRSGSGANEPPHGERKETDPDWRPRQGRSGGKHPVSPTDRGPRGRDGDDR